MSLAPGSAAPQFSLFDTDRNTISLADYTGKKVILAFYPGAFTGVCTKELCTLRDSISQFNSLNAIVLGVSVDSPFANKAFKDQNLLEFPLLSDYTRAISRAYGGVHEDFAGLTDYAVSKRAVFVVNESGAVAYAWVSDDPGVEPLYDEIKKAIS